MVPCALAITLLFGVLLMSIPMGRAPFLLSRPTPATYVTGHINNGFDILFLVAPLLILLCLFIPQSALSSDMGIKIR
jgi:hypothetical protein